jgi:hypothetical protein
MKRGLTRGGALGVCMHDMSYPDDALEPVDMSVEIAVGSGAPHMSVDRVASLAGRQRVDHRLPFRDSRDCVRIAEGFDFSPLRKERG